MGWPTGREPDGHGVPIVLVGVTSRQGTRESRVQGGSGPGGWRARSGEVRERRNAEAARALVRGYAEKATGELMDTETVTSSSEGGRWKRAEGYLAGGLPYRMHGLVGGMEETGRKVPRPVPTQRRPPTASARTALPLLTAAHRER